MQEIRRFHEAKLVLEYLHMEWYRINERLCILRVKASFSLVCAHTPTEDKEVHLYNQLGQAYKKGSISSSRPLF